MLDPAGSAVGWIQLNICDGRFPVYNPSGIPVVRSSILFHQCSVPLMGELCQVLRGGTCEHIVLCKSGGVLSFDFSVSEDNTAACRNKLYCVCIHAFRLWIASQCVKMWHNCNLSSFVVAQTLTVKWKSAAHQCSLWPCSLSPFLFVLLDFLGH